MGANLRPRPFPRKAPNPHVQGQPQPPWVILGVPRQRLPTRAIRAIRAIKIRAISNH